MGVVKVKKGNEVFEIQDTDLKDAVKDGYLPTDTVIVANSKTKEMFEIAPEDLPDAFSDGFDFSGVKKKVGGIGSALGGAVGTSVPQSEKQKLTDYLYGLKTKEEKQLAAPTTGITTTLKQKPKKVDEQALNTINTIMYEDSDRWKDPVKSIVEESKNVSKFEDLDVYNRAAELTRNSLAGSGYKAKVLLADTFLNAERDNMTASMLKNRAEQYDKISEPFRNLQFFEGNTITDNPDLDYNAKDKLYDAAIRAYANKYPLFGKQAEAAGIDLSSTDLRRKLGDKGYAGIVMSDILQDKDFVDFVQNENPKYLNVAQNAANDLLKDNREYGINVVANEISKERQKLGLNNPIVEFDDKRFKDETDLVAQKLYRNDPVKMQIYEEVIKRNPDQYLDTPSLLEGISQGAEGVYKGIGTSFEAPFTSILNQIKEGWEKEASNVTADPKGVSKFLSGTGHVLGLVGALGGVGNVIGGGGTGLYSQKIAPFLSGTVPFAGDFWKEAVMKYPDSPAKAALSTTLNTALYGALSQKIFPTKQVQQAFENVKPGIGQIVENLASGKITREVARREANTLIKQGFDFLKGTVSKSAKISAELTGITAANRALDKLFMDEQDFEKYHPEDELQDSFKTLFLDNLVLGGMTKYSDMKKGNAIVEESLYEAATNPLRYKRVIDEMEVKDPTISKEDMLNNLGFLSMLKTELDKRGIAERNQKRYLFEAMKEKAIKQELSQMPESNITRRGQEQILRGQEIKNDILNGENVNEEMLVDENYVNPLPPKETIAKAVADEVLTGAEAEAFKKGEITEEDILLSLAQQKYGVLGDGSISPTGGRDISMKTSLDVDEAVEKVYPNAQSVQEAIQKQKTSQQPSISVQMPEEVAKPEVVEPQTAETTVSEIESKKSDIEKRRQEELNKIKPYKDVFEAVKKANVDTDSVESLNKIKQAAIDLKIIDSTAGNSFVRSNGSKFTAEENVFVINPTKEINAKYDAELADLEKQFTSQSGKSKTATPTAPQAETKVTEDWSKDVESTAKALEDVSKKENPSQKVLENFNSIKNYYYPKGSKKLFHGSSVESLEMDRDGLIWFTDDKRVADDYRKRSIASNEADTEGYDENILESKSGIEVIADEQGIDLSKGKVFVGQVQIKKPLDLTQNTDSGNIENLEKLWDKLNKEGLVEKWDEIDEEYRDEMKENYEGKALWKLLEDENIYDSARKNGYDAVIISDVGTDGKIHKSYGVFSVKNFYESSPKAFSQAYHKAKADGTNPELVKAVEDLLGKPQPEAAKTTVSDAEALPEAAKQAETKVTDSAKQLADKVRSLKIDLSKLGDGGLQSNPLGLPVAVWNAAIDTIALAIEGGATLAQAVQKAIKKHNLDKQKGFNQKEFISKLEQASGEKLVEEVPPGEPPPPPKEVGMVGEMGKEDNLDKLANNVPDTGKVADYLSGETIQKYTGEAPINDQTRGVQELQIALEHGEKIIEEAKAVFGDDYVEKTLDYIERSKAGVSNKALMYVSLENALGREKLANPENAADIAKMQKLVYEKSQAFARQNSLALNYQKLRKIAQVGYDMSRITDNFFSAEELVAREVINKATEANGDLINEQYAAQETGSITPEVQKLIEEGIAKEVAKLYEALPKEKKSLADRAIKALESAQAKLRSRTYDAGLGVPVAIVDAGITVIKNAIKVGVTIEKAIQLGINKIKELYKEELSEEREEKLRTDLTEVFHKVKSVKDTVKEILIEKGFGREVNVKGETKNILDWKKLAGEAGTVTKISENVGSALKDKGYTETDIKDIKDQFIDEYVSLRQSIIEKAQNELAKRNKETVSPEQKSAAKKLSELYTYGLFDAKFDEYENTLNKALGAKVSEQGFNEAKNIAKALDNIYKSTFKGIRLNDVSAKSAIEKLEDKLRILLFRESKSQGNLNLKAANIVRSYFDTSQTMLLNNLKQAVENPFSGLSQSAINTFEGVVSGTSNKELRKRQREAMKTIYKDMVLSGGIAYGKVESQFVNRQHLDDLVNKMSDKKLYHAIASAATGKATLNAMDSMFKASITEKKFVANLIKILTHESNPKRMTKKEALQFATERLTGQTYKEAKKTALETIKKINEDAGQELIPEGETQVERLANDIVKASLEMGGKITQEQIQAAYNAAYKSAGLNLGHEANNLLSGMMKGYTAKLEGDISRALKDKEWNRASFLIYKAVLFRNILNPFVGGGTNWLVLKMEKTGLGLFTGLAYKLGSKSDIDLSSEIGLKRLEARLYNQARYKDSFMRGLVGGVTSVLAYGLFKALVDDDEYRKFRKENPWAARYLDIATPEMLLAEFGIKDDEFAQYISRSFNRGDAFDAVNKVIKAVNYASKGEYGKMWGALGEGLGMKLNAPVPWRLVKDAQVIYQGIKGEDPYHGNYKPSNGFFSGVLQGGVIEWLGGRPVQEETSSNKKKPKRKERIQKRKEKREQSN